MKRKNYKRTLISCLCLWSVIMGSLLFYSPKNIALSATGVPEIKIIAPETGVIIEKAEVEFSGKISEDGKDPSKLLVKVFEQTGESEQPKEITDEGKLNITPQGQYSDFTFSKEFTEGTHALTFIVTNETGVSNMAEESFTVNLASTVQTGDEKTGVQVPNSLTTANKKVLSQLSQDPPIGTLDEIGNRPYMAQMYLIPKGSEGEYTPNEEIPTNYMPAEDMTRVPLNYIILVDIRSIMPLSDEKPLITTFGNIEGEEHLFKTFELADNYTSYVYTYSPKQDFLAAATYNVYLNPQFSTESGIGIIPRFLKFTAVSETYKDYQPNKGDGTHDYIHGPFSNATNACSICHSTHKGNNDKLVSGQNGEEENALCMSCHDGTNGSGAPNIMQTHTENKHFVDSSVSCSSCHNPHNPGMTDNPNSLIIETDSTTNTKELLTYKKVGTAKGEAEDFTLCFRCHNGKIDVKTNNPISNIEQYYKDDAFKSQSGHNFLATTDSGTSLDGQLPCAECHETHGSDNIKMIRGTLGNTNSSDNAFSKKTGDWDAPAERNFCLACHNSKTVLYGKTANAIFDKSGESLNTTTDQIKEGHNRGSERACSECHSNNNSFIEAAHSPIK